MRYSDLTPLGRMVVTVCATLALLLLMSVAGAIETQAAPAKKRTDCATLYFKMIHAPNSHTQARYWVMGWKNGCFHAE